MNETHLHKTLKTIYALEIPGSRQEIAVGKYIADIITPDGDIIEIQTGSLSHLAPKIKDFTKNGRNVRIVYPLAVQKYIETASPDGKTRRRKSPVKKNLYSTFKELTSLCPLLTDRMITLEVIETVITEERKETDEAVQSKNGRRRFRKNWIKTGKRLESAGKKHVFCGKESYKALMPEKTDDTFTFPDFFIGLREIEKNVKEEEARIFLWCLCRMGIVEKGEKKGRLNTYYMA